jgi:8-oxo-dGTP pyrophosphatase MutT (NUDIX family)
MILRFRHFRTDAEILLGLEHEIGAMIPNKACPVVLRERYGATEILVFRHPAGDIQLVKGTIEHGESPADAAVRELLEESGITAIGITRDLGLWDAEFEYQVWSFHLCEVTEQPDTWTFFTADEGGMDFELFWIPFNADTNDEWHPVHKNALQFIRAVLTRTSL